MSDWKNDNNTPIEAQAKQAESAEQASARPVRHRRSDRYAEEAPQATRQVPSRLVHPELPEAASQATRQVMPRIVPSEAPQETRQLASRILPSVPPASVPQETRHIAPADSRQQLMQQGRSGRSAASELSSMQPVERADRENAEMAQSSVRRPLEAEDYQTRRPMGMNTPNRAVSGVRSSYSQPGYPGRSREYGRSVPPPGQEARRPVRSSEPYSRVEQPEPRRGGWLAVLVALVLLLGLVAVGFLLIDENSDSVWGQAKRTVVEQVSALLGMDKGLLEGAPRVETSGFSASVNSGTAPMDVVFNLITNKAVTQVRLVDDTGMPMNSTSKPLTENSGDSIIWMINLHLTSGYQGNVQAQVFDGSAWLNTDMFQRLTVAEPVVPTASLSTEAFAGMNLPTDKPSPVPDPIRTPESPELAVLPLPVATQTPVITQKPVETPRATPTPTMIVTPTPTMMVTATPTMMVTATPTVAPTNVPTSKPSEVPAVLPVATETPAPVETPMATQVPLVTQQPTAVPATPTPTLKPTEAPTATPTVRPSPTAAMTVEAAKSADPSLIHDTVIYNKTNRVSEYNRVKPLNMPDAENYLPSPLGVLTYRGSAFRQNAARGTVEDVNTMTLAWTAESGSVKGASSTYYGVGWTGQPAIIQWPMDVRNLTNIYPEKINTKALKEVIIAGLDGRIYFLDLMDGKPTRDVINLGYPMRGTPSIHPLGYPLMIVGQYARKMASGQGDIGLYFYNMLNQKQIYWIDGLDGDDDRPYYSVGAFDTSPLIDVSRDTLVTVGTNGMLYTADLGTVVGGGEGDMKLKIDPLVVSMKSRTKDQADKYVAVEASHAMYGSYVFYADMQGVLRCVDTTTMTTAWAVETGDAVQAAIALDQDADGNVWLYTANVLENRKKGDCNIRRFNASTGEEDWSFDVNVALNAVKKSKTPGAMASPVIGQGALEDLVYFTLSNVSKTGMATIFGQSEGAAAGVLVALDKRTGDVVWASKLDSYSYSSPVAVYSTDGAKGWIIQADASGKLTMFNGKTGEVITTLKLEGTIEASPAVFNNMLVIATTEKGANYIYGVELGVTE